jgi:hypothetical protein
MVEPDGDHDETTADNTILVNVTTAPKLAENGDNACDVPMAAAAAEGAPTVECVAQTANVGIGTTAQEDGIHAVPNTEASPDVASLPRTPPPHELLQHKAQSEHGDRHGAEVHGAEKEAGKDAATEEDASEDEGTVSGDDGAEGDDTGFLDEDREEDCLSLDEAMQRADAKPLLLPTQAKPATDAARMKRKIAPAVQNIASSTAKPQKRRVALVPIT